MGLREIDIPFGPDKTGGLGFGVLADKVDPDGLKDPFASPVSDNTESYEQVSNQSPQAWTSWQGIPSSGQSNVPSPMETQALEPMYQATAFSELVTEEEPEYQASYQTGSPEVSRASEPDDIDLFLDEDEAGQSSVQMSFAALRTSLGQSRELKARERDLDNLRERLESERQELEDRDYILANYPTLVAEQQRVIDECTRQRESDKEELAQIVTQLEQISLELENAQAYHSEQMKPLQTEIGRANAAADQAKNDERSRKSELTAAEAEVRRAATANEKAMAQAKYDHIKQAYDTACAVSSDAQGNLNELNRIYEDALHQIEQTEGPLKRAIEDLQNDENELKNIIVQLGEDISVARKRLQYCEGVKQFPEETEKLRSAVKLDEEELAEMEEDLDYLNEQLAESKKKARKAKAALALGVVVVIAIVAALVYVFSR